MSRRAVAPGSLLHTDGLLSYDRLENCGYRYRITFLKGRKESAAELQELLDYIAQRAKEDKINNVQTVLGEFDDPKLPTRRVDLPFIHKVLHYVEHRALFLKALATHMKPTGRIVIIDADQEQPNATHGDEPKFQYSKDQVKQWMEDAGFRPVEEFPELLDRQFFFIFARR